MTDTKGAIMTAIANCKDDDLRAVLLLMLGVLEEIGSKIDGVLQDEKTLREIVLNGHTATHDDDHIWLDNFRKRAEHYHDDHVWITEKRVAEEALRQSKRKVSETVVAHLMTSGASILVTLILLGIAAAHGFFK